MRGVSWAAIAMACCAAGCWRSHTISDDAGLDSGVDSGVFCSPDAGVTGDLSDCVEQQGGAFVELEVCVPVQVNFEELHTAAQNWHGRGVIRCGWRLFGAHGSSGTRLPNPGVTMGFDERRCPSLEEQCTDCSQTEFEFRDRVLFGAGYPGEIIDRGVYTVSVEGYDGEARIRVTREETLPDEQCVVFTPRRPL